MRAFRAALANQAVLNARWDGSALVMTSYVAPGAMDRKVLRNATGSRGKAITLDLIDRNVRIPAIDFDDIVTGGT
ncbi:hypothetical protein AA0242T_3094 [Acetobacter aceti NRIC 0242]|uniref:Uncharacterized protein n=6 Tax=Acetobacteraceae TaxID=433 RepID=A0AB33IE75_ACEAC|nr:hypothetical protein EMQ_1827 [Acetobacter aceti NBRC 14818]GBO82392.1 hypothetical protein AA0242T_3094 [Acetobacter aceti NRIC 0242]GBQ51244.1 hypothetical protein AA0498_1423 [Acidomonas methanolica]GBQ64819.1 hypothetical protein AA0474_0681 [Acetobacter lovaniensis NRIC 0474]GBR08951.1 hypothetical protein AA21952_2735 [Acetobacter oeni LMG 21952]GEL00076.1 hypothetical protein AME01nite_25740 [Acidomonas methanolica NBRC 104435]